MPLIGAGGRFAGGRSHGHPATAAGFWAAESDQSGPTDQSTLMPAALTTLIRRLEIDHERTASEFHGKVADGVLL